MDRQVKQNGLIGILLDDTEGCVITDVTCQGLGTGIQARNTKNLQISNYTSIGCGVALDARKSFNLQIRDILSVNLSEADIVRLYKALQAKEKSRFSGILRNIMKKRISAEKIDACWSIFERFQGVLP